MSPIRFYNKWLLERLQLIYLRSSSFWEDFLASSSRKSMPMRGVLKS